MLSFIEFLINEVNGTNTLSKAIKAVGKTMENPVKKELNKIKKSINKSMIGNKISKTKQAKLARMKTIQANCSRIKKINTTIKKNSVQK